MPGLSGAGEAILRGADDAMWIAEPADPGAIARVTAAGTVTEFTRRRDAATSTPNREPSGLPDRRDRLAGRHDVVPDVGGGDELGRITTAGSGRRATRSSDGRPTSLAGGPDGRLWMTVEGEPAIPTRSPGWTTANTTPRPFSSGLTSSTNPRSITAGPDGALWFVESGGSGRHRAHHDQPAS